MTTLKTISPVDNKVYYSKEASTDAQIKQAVSNAHNTQKKWRQTSLATRAKICKEIINYFNKKKDEIAKEITWQMGRPISQSAGEIAGFSERANYMIDIAPQALEKKELPQKDNFTRFINREPIGIVFVVAPWNYPYLTSVNAIIPAIMAGNVVILKPSTQTLKTGEHYQSAFEYALNKTNNTEFKDIFKSLYLTHEQTLSLSKNKDIDYIAFTGSVQGGQKIQSASSIANKFSNVGLELGGKDPAYVREDINTPDLLKNTVENLVDGAFFNSGQSCCGVERIYVHKSLYNDFVDLYVQAVKKYKLGNPTDKTTNLGPVVRESAAKYIKEQIKEAIDLGACAHISPDDFDIKNIGENYLAPQVLTNTNHKMSIMKEESFGPVVGIMSVESDEQAIELMNDSDYGLTASIWTQDEIRAINIGSQVQTGTWFMNRCDYLDPALAWCGVKNSGRGITLSALGYEHLTRVKSYHLKKRLVND